MTHKIWGTAQASLHPTSLSALRLKYALEDIKSYKAKNVLEVGCGAGMFTDAISGYAKKIKVFGCDVDKPAIEEAKSGKHNVQYKVGSLYKLPYKAKNFDSVISFDVFEHLENPEKAFNEVKRVLVPQGIFHLYVPCEGNLYTIYGLAKVFGFIPKLKFAGHIQQYKTKDLMHMAESSGFEIKNVRYSSHFINQIVDFSYFIFLTLFNRKTSRTVEGYISENASSYKYRILGTIKNLLATIFYYESTIFKHVPAHGVHLTLVKK